MKTSTMIKLGALGIATATTAAGSVYVAAKAVKALSEQTFPENPEKKGIDIKHVPSISKLKADGVKVNPIVKKEEKKEEEPAKTLEYKYEVPKPQPIPVIPEPVPEPIPFATPVEPAPVVNTVPDVVDAFVAPVVPEIPVAPVVDPVAAPAVAPVVEESGYSDLPMDLPYLAGKLGEEEEECEDKVETPVEKEAEAITEAQPVVEEPVVEPVIEPTIEPTVEPAIEVTNAGEPVLPTAEPIDELPTEAPILEAQKAEETFADINPLSEGFSIAMNATEGEVLPTATEAGADVSFADLQPEVAPTPAPITFNDLNTTSDYVEEVAPVMEVKPAPVIELAPVVEEPAQVPVVEPAPVKAGKTIKIGGAEVSDETSNAFVKAVADKFEVPANNLVAIAAEGNMPMVFEFLYSDMRNDASLINVYFVMPDGQATVPPEAEKENVLAFGRSFITGNEELKKFLA